MSLWLDDGDVRLYHGDALETVRGMPDESVDCVVTSPPYWGLRDYGTGSWDGGDPDCDHDQAKQKGHADYGFSEAAQVQTSNVSAGFTRYATECPCGATRIDRQMGLEPTPDLFVAGMVELFREIRRVLAPHGTCWVNLGDSYAASGPAGGEGKQHTNVGSVNVPVRKPTEGLKPKDLVGIPWRVAFALQADGWWLRSDIIWAKPNPMPESVSDRPTKSHEYVFLLTKQPRYWFDTEAVREPHRTADDSRNRPDYEPSRGRAVGMPDGEVQRIGTNGASTWPSGGRNVRSVWNIATQPYPEAHFATFPEELARRCILAGCPTRVCRVCGKPSERIVEREPTQPGVTGGATPYDGGRPDGMTLRAGGFGNGSSETVGWSDCGHNNWRTGVVLDPFMGSGTTAKVARDHQRHAIGIDLNQAYLELAARRLQQLSLLT